MSNDTVINATYQAYSARQCDYINGACIIGVMLPIPFTPELGEIICDGLISAKPMTLIAKEIGISTTTIAKWQRSNPLFADAVKFARAEAAHLLVDQAEQAARDMDPRRARNLIHVLLFAAERRNRAAYGPTMDMTVADRVDLGGTLIEARKRLLRPGCDPTPALPVQDVEYALIMTGRATDNESVAQAPAVNPFD